MQQKSWIKDQTVRYNFNETESSLSKSDFDDFGQIVPSEDFKIHFFFKVGLNLHIRQSYIFREQISNIWGKIYYHKA